MFELCSDLKLDSLNFNWANITSIGDTAFMDCTSLTGTIYLSKECNVSSSAFSNCPLVRKRIGY
jgi:hypothetical protein